MLCPYMFALIIREQGIPSLFPELLDGDQSTFRLKEGFIETHYS